MNPRISIIVPVYNVEKYLSKCIDSILNQTFTDFELILVNDGSCDKSAIICEEYKKLDDRIKVIHKLNGGLSSARNIGIEESKGDFIGFIDSDDYIHPQMFEILYNNMKISNSDLVLCDYKRVDENESHKLKLYNIDDINSNSYTNMEALRELQGNKGITYVVAWNKLYKRKLFDNIRYKEGKIHEDEFIIHELLYKCNRVSYLPIELYYYLQRSNSITTCKFNISRLDGLDAYIERILFYERINKKELKDKAELIYIREFLAFYHKLENEVENPTQYLKNIRNKFKRRIIGFIKNDYLTYKEKLGLIAFSINPCIYEKYKEIKNGGF